MSNWHALISDLKQDRVRVAFHVLVPDEANAVGINLRNAVKDCPEINKTTAVAWLQTDYPIEFAAIADGSIYEHVEDVQFSAHASDGEKRTACDAHYSNVVTKIETQLRNRLKFWGLNRDVS